MDASGCGVTDTELATQRQCGHPGFRLADQVNGQKPKGQRQTRSLKEGSGNQRSLMATMATLKGLALLISVICLPCGSITLLPHNLVEN